MRKPFTIGIVLSMIVIIVGGVAWMSFRLPADDLKHETTRWAVIEDYGSDRLAVETTSGEVWSQLVQLNQDGSRLWVGGIVERYNNSWGFRFKPESLTVAEVTAEALQANIRYVSENLNQWLGGWAYVPAEVVEIHV